MKFFILLAIIFFSYRIFASDDVQYYESRYYNIDEYIHFESDPHYEARLKAKRAEARALRQGVDEYKAQKEKEAARQEKNRQAHLSAIVTQEEQDFDKLEADHERQKQKEQQEYLKLQARYLLERDRQETNSKPARSIASTASTFDEAPIKRVPRHKRKYIPRSAPTKK